MSVISVASSATCTPLKSPAALAQAAWQCCKQQELSSCPALRVLSSASVLHLLTWSPSGVGGVKLVCAHACVSIH